MECSDVEKARLSLLCVVRQGAKTKRPEARKVGAQLQPENRRSSTRHDGQDDTTRDDDSSVAGPRRGGRVGNEQAPD